MQKLDDHVWVRVMSIKKAKRFKPPMAISRQEKNARVIRRCACNIGKYHVEVIA